MLRGVITKSGSDDEEEPVRNWVWYGHDYALPYTWAGLNTGYRRGGYKLINNSGVVPDDWYAPPDLPITEDGKCGMMVSEYHTGYEAQSTQYLLYDLESDPLEMRDVSEEHSDVVQQMLDEMGKIRETQLTPMQWDMSCPLEIEYAVHEEVGQVWGPWC